MKRPTLPLLAVLFSFKLALLAGCADECKQLADLACEKAGEQSDECKKIRTRAESATADDKRSCGKALAVVNLFTAKN
ncbi:MAG: hypothetical protein U1F43_20980 [Myxococcota bacterium]